MATPYSIRLFAGLVTHTGAFDVVFTVPAGAVAVVRDIERLAIGAGFGTQMVAASVAGFFRNNATAALTSEQWQGRVVLNAGESLESFGPAGTQVALVISGYLLRS